VKVIGSKAFRAPSIYELEYQDGCTSQVRPASLDPESIYSAEIEVMQRVSPRWTALVAGYGTFADDLIILGTADGTRFPECDDNLAPAQYRNSTDEVLTLGGEAEVRREWRQGWMASASYSVQRTRAADGFDVGDPTGRHVPNSPAHLAALRMAAPVVPRALTVMTRLSFEGSRWDRHDTPGDPAQRATAPAVLWDLALSGRTERIPARWVLGLYNAFDWRWEVPVSREFRQRTVPQNGRTLLLSADVEY
jgi:outer membrane cobalamin receptor